MNQIRAGGLTKRFFKLAVFNSGQDRRQLFKQELTVVHNPRELQHGDGDEPVGKRPKQLIKLVQQHRFLLVLVRRESQTAIHLLVRSPQCPRDAFMQRPFRFGPVLHITAALRGGVKSAHREKHVVDDDILACKDLLDVLRQVGVFDDVRTALAPNIVLETRLRARVDMFRESFRLEPCVQSKVGQELNQECGAGPASAGDNNMMPTDSSQPLAV